MKRILVPILIAIALVSCKEPDTTNHVYSETELQQQQQAEIPQPLIPTTYVCDFPYSKSLDVLNVVTIGECEYLVANAGQQSDITITHKGDCKFCIQRQEELIRRILAEKNR